MELNFCPWRIWQFVLIFFWVTCLHLIAEIAIRHLLKMILVNLLYQRWLITCLLFTIESNGMKAFDEVFFIHYHNNDSSFLSCIFMLLPCSWLMQFYAFSTSHGRFRHLNWCMEFELSNGLIWIKTLIRCQYLVLESYDLVTLTNIWIYIRFCDSSHHKIFL